MIFRISSIRRSRMFKPLKMYVLALGVLFLFGGCALTGNTHKDVVDLSINVNKLYNKVLDEYEITYDTSSKETQEYLKNEIEPELNEIGQDLHSYNQIVLSGDDNLRLRRTIIMRLLNLRKEIDNE
jgi:hypothetical protein